MTSLGFNAFMAAGIITGASVLSVSAQAASVYLTCTFTPDGKPSVIEFTADEAVGKVSIFITSSGRSRTVNGAFTPDRVLVEERDVRWVINRTDLSIVRTIKMINSDDLGHCKIKEAPKRAF